MAAPTGETVAPDQLEFSLTPADAAGHEGDEVTLDLSEEAGGPAQKGAPEVAAPVETTVPPVADTAETARAAGPVDVTDVAEATDVADAAAPEVPVPSGAEVTSARTASTPEGEPEDHAVPEVQAEQAPAERPQGQENPDRPLEPAETEAAQTAQAEAAAEDRPSAEEEPAEPVDSAEPAEPAEAAEPTEPTPAPWGSADLRQRIYTEVQEFVAAIARRDVNELASRYGMAGNDLAGLDEQLAGLSSPASDLTLYPLEQADDYVDGHHRLDLSELEGGGVVISSELWAHDRPCGARLIAHWNPMGIYPFDFRNVSM